jgi:predicted ATPase
MEESSSRHLAIVGREKEFAELKEFLSGAVRGEGITVLVFGEPGIGKTRLVDEFKSFSGKEKIKVLAGAASSDSFRPFLVFSDALAGEVDYALFSEEEYASFSQIFVINRAGMLLAKASPESEDMDADIFAGMLSAVQDFVRDSFDQSGEKKAGLGKLEYGDMKILIEHGRHVFLTAVFRSQEHPEMREVLKRTLKQIEEKCGKTFENWSGKMSELEPVQDSVTALAGARFLVRKDMEGKKLENERLKLADRVLDTLAGLSGKQQIVMILEDMHWADESSLFVLQYLARNIKESKIMILCTARPERSAHLAKALEAMRADALLAELPLKKMEKPDIFSLIDSRYFPNDFPQAFKEQMFGTCAGNPFFIIELLKQMSADGHIKRTAGTFTLESEAYTVPTTVEEVVQKRLDALEPDAMALAEYVSCAGRSFDVKMLASFSSIPDSSSTFEKLKAASIVERQNGTASFCHALFQDSLYKSISARWKAVHHKAIGEYYETTYAGKQEDVLYELARHFALSGEHQKALSYCVKAGEKAEASYAMEKAAEFYEMALANLGKASGMMHKEEREFDLKMRLGNAHMLYGSLDKTLTTFEEIVSKCEDGALKATVYNKISQVREKKGNYKQALDEAVKGQGFVGKDSQLHWKLEIQKATILSRTGQYDESIAICRNVLSAIKDLDGYESDAGLAYNTLGMCHWYKGEFPHAMEAYGMSQRISEKKNDLFGIASCHNNIGILLQVQGDLENALGHHQKALAIREKIKSQHGIADSLNNIGLIYYDLARLDEALDIQLKSLKIRQKIGHMAGISLSYSNIGEIYRNKGELATAEDNYKKSLELKQKMGDKWGQAMCLNNLGVVYNERGEHGKAIDVYDKSIKICNEINTKEFLIHARLGKAEAMFLEGGLDQAMEIAEEAEKISRESGIKKPVYDSLALQGRMYARKGQWEKAEEKLTEAVSGFKEMKSETDVAIMQYHSGEMHLARKKKERAEKDLQSALASFRKLGLAHWQEKCEKAMKDIER